MELKPTLPQWELMNSGATFPAFVGGFGSGKTDSLINRLLLKKIAYPDNNIGFYEPTWDLVRTIAFPRWEERLTELNIPYKLIKSPMNVIKIEGCGDIIFRSMERPERIVGFEVADSGVDELDTLKTKDAEYCWRQIIARNRQKKPDGSINSVAVATTPEGFKFVYLKWQKNRTASYQLIKAPTSSNAHNLPPGYIDSLAESYPPHLLNAYLEGEFVNLQAGTVYYCFDRRLNHTSEAIQPREPLHIGIDFNVGNMSAVTHVIRDNRPMALDELHGITDTPAMIDTIKSHYPGHAVIVYPDASGRSRKTVNASLSDLQLLKDAGFRVVVDTTNPAVRDRLTSMNAALLNANGERRYLINTEKCPNYTLCLEQQAYDKNGDPDKQHDLDHLPDAGGYFIAKRFPVIKKSAQMIKMVGH